MDLECDVLVVGAGCGGVAAALAAARLGRRVVLTDPSGWLGGQLTAQAVPADEHPWIESTGATAGYRAMRSAVRDRYRTDPQLTDRARRYAHLNPGGGWVSALCAEPTVIHDVLTAILDPHRRSGALRRLPHYRPVRAELSGDHIDSITLESTTGADPVIVHASYVLDATEEGDLLPLTGCEHVLGAEGTDDTGEPHAREQPDPHDQQGITWCAALEWRPGEEHTIERPDDYDFWLGYQASFWPGPQLGWATAEPETGNPLHRPLFGAAGEQDLWRFRRIRAGEYYRPARTDISLINWPQNDYWLAPITGADDRQREQRLAAARNLTLSLIYWLQTDAPRPDGGTGYPGLRLHPTALGTTDGLAAAPYIRESRRIRGVVTVLEQHIGVEARAGASSAHQFPDSVGIGSYRIDLHPTPAGRGYLDIASYPFQIPLGALLPVRIDNLVAAGKCLGVTHITNGCYRLHPVEWNIGEAAGAVAAHALAEHTTPHAIHARGSQLAAFQGVLTQLGIPLAWPEAIRTQTR